MSRDNIQQQLKRQLADLENQIYDLETFYLENTRDSGNLLKGFDNYLNAKAPRNQFVKKPKIQCVERLFSLSSVRSKTSQAFEETSHGGEMRLDNSQLHNHKRNRSRGMSNKMGKSYNPHDHDDDQISASMEAIYSMDQSSANKAHNKQHKRKKIGKSSKGPRKF